MAESWEELSLVSASPTLIKKGIEGVVMKHVAKAARQQKGIDYMSATESVQANDKISQIPRIYKVYILIIIVAL